MIFLRRIDPDTVLKLFNLPRPQAAYGEQLLRMDLVKWIADDVFVADIAGSRFEVTVRDQPQVLFSSRPQRSSNVASYCNRRSADSDDTPFGA